MYSSTPTTAPGEELSAPKTRTVALPFEEKEDKVFLALSLEKSRNPLPPCLLVHLGQPAAPAIRLFHPLSQSESLSGSEDDELDDIAPLLVKLKITRDHRSRRPARTAQPRHRDPDRPHSPAYLRA
ncbi:hypothetical protein D9613_009659 [Agrocybe pediades]|uniref:Uncharacterized protein n=1 Tax=Agrocybe pediades TaxID=84607 RepID=A0A8H4QY83_9AGAR|nr:hypothetical protein D9613_009659 [Agrocybe pediades]KAF9557007.1 hypothetical protein CPC08DRAFT_764857 [Agrocybe pediades]